MLTIDPNLDPSDSEKSEKSTRKKQVEYSMVANEQLPSDITPQPPQRVQFALNSPTSNDGPSSEQINLGNNSLGSNSLVKPANNVNPRDSLMRPNVPDIFVKELGRPSLTFDDDIQLRGIQNLSKDSIEDKKVNATQPPVHKKQESDLMVLPEDEQRAFEAKMDQFLLQENLPKVLTENEQSAN